MKLAFDITVLSKKDQNLSPIILLHAGLDSRKSWKHVATELSKTTGRKVYALDLRNHGESPWSDEFDFEVLTDDVEEFLSDHNIAKAIVIGHSTGGRTAITLALRKPEKVEKLIIEDMIVEPYSDKVKTSVLQLFQLVKNSLSAIPQGADLTEAKKAVQEYIKSHLPEEASKKGTLYDLDTVPLKKTGDTYAWQANIAALEEMVKSGKSSQNFSGVFMGDALFLHGTKSFLDVANDKSIEKFFPRAVLHPIEGAGHSLHRDYPEIFLKQVSKFILDQ